LRRQRYDIVLKTRGESRQSLDSVHPQGRTPHTPFSVTANEVTAAKQHGPSYRLYRVFDFRKGPRICISEGDLQAAFSLQPTTWRASR